MSPEAQRIIEGAKTKAEKRRRRKIQLIK